MYDHLDDPTPPIAEEQVRAEVLQRADRLRWRRRAIVLSSCSAVVVAVVLSVVALSGPPGKSSLIVGSPRPTATETVTAYPTPTTSPTPVTTSAPPVPQPGRTPEPTGSPIPSPTACHGPGCPDGSPGWSTGYASCSPAAVAADGAGAPPVDGMVLSLALPSAVAGGKDARGTLTITNNSSVTVSFEVRQPRIGMEAGIAGPGGHSSTHASDALGSEAFELAPGRSDSVNVVAHASSCGDGSGDPETALPPGAYQVGVTVGYVNAQRVDGGSPSPSPGPEVRSYGSWSVAQSLQIT